MDLSTLSTLEGGPRLAHFALSSREVAALIWLGVFAVAAGVDSNVRRGGAALIRAFCQPIILTVLGAASVYIAGCVVLLALLGLWDWTNLKMTLIWAVTFAFVTLFDVEKITTDDGQLRKVAADTLGATTFIVFLAEFYTMPLLAELVVLPLGVVATLGKAVAERNKQSAAVPVFGCLIDLIGLVLLGWAVSTVIIDRANFFAWATLRELTVPILLSFLFFPFLLSMATYVAYDTVTRQVDWAVEDERLRRRAALSAFLAFRTNFKLLRRWSRQILNHPPRSGEEVDRLIAEVKRLARLETSPPQVQSEEGWSPNIARLYLADQGLLPDDYHPLHDEWFASTRLVPLGAGIFEDNIAYYVEGDEAAARRLKIKLNVNNPAAPDETEVAFRRAAVALVARAIGSDAATAVTPLLAEDIFDIALEQRRVWLVRSEHLGGRGYTRILQVDYRPGYPSEYDRLLQGE